MKEGLIECRRSAGFWIPYIEEDPILGSKLSDFGLCLQAMRMPVGHTLPDVMGKVVRINQESPRIVFPGANDSLHLPRDSINWQDTYLPDPESINYRIHQTRCQNHRHFIIRLHFSPLPSREIIRMDFSVLTNQVPAAQGSFISGESSDGQGSCGMGCILTDSITPPIIPRMPKPVEYIHCRT